MMVNIQPRNLGAISVASGRSAMKYSKSRLGREWLGLIRKLGAMDTVTDELF